MSNIFIFFLYYFTVENFYSILYCKVITMIKYENLEVNLTDDNNFYVSHTTASDITYRIKTSPNSVKGEELELLKRVEERKQICKDQDIHYWVLPNPNTSDDTHCHFCDVPLAFYSRMERLGTLRRQ